MDQTKELFKITFIAHRGNLNGTNKSFENSTSYIDNALLYSDVELDIWKIDGTLYLGHDEPQYKISIDYLLKNYDKIWCHAKNLNALEELLKHPQLNMFWHQEDDYTITTHKFIWVYPGKPLIPGCICVMPERANYKIEELKKCYGICTDEVLYYTKLLSNS